MQSLGFSEVANTDTRSRLLALRDELSSRSKRGNFSLPENIHLTLAFLFMLRIYETFL